MYLVRFYTLTEICLSIAYTNLQHGNEGEVANDIWCLGNPNLYAIFWYCEVHFFMNVRGMMSISSYVHMIIVVEIEGEDEHSKVFFFLNVHRKCYLQRGRSSCTVPADRPHPQSNNFIYFFVRHVNWSSCIYQSQRVLTRAMGRWPIAQTMMGRRLVALTRRRLPCARSILE